MSHSTIRLDGRSQIR